MNQPGRVPDLEPGLRIIGLVGYFNALRSLAGVIDNSLTMSIIEDWQRHTYVRLERWERECIFAMDRAFRQSYGAVLKWHAERKQIKTGKDRDWNRANGRRS